MVSLLSASASPSIVLFLAAMGMRRLIAPLPFTLHHGWVGEDEVNGPWLHALLVRR